MRFQPTVEMRTAVNGIFFTRCHVGRDSCFIRRVNAVTAERILATLSVVAAGLLMTAIFVTGGKAPPMDAASAAQPLWTLPSLATLSNGSPFIAGAVGGWLLRWIYCLPWAAVPRAVIAWVLGWRWSVVMLGIAVGCMAILVLY